MSNQNKRKKWRSPYLTNAGLKCPDCGCRHFTVDGTRKSVNMIVRYRLCRNCGRRITTCERVI